jgi:hypothetical protein
VTGFPAQALAVAAVVVGLWGFAAALHLGTLAAASVFYRAPRPDRVPRVRFLTLIPAHDEALVIGACLAALLADRRPDDPVVVVADRCTDETAAIARRMGAIVLERGPDAAPGRAAARQAGLELARGLSDWDTVLMVDADSIVEPGFYDACERMLASGADAVQARSEGAPGTSFAAEASVAAFTLQGVTIPRGRDRLLRAVRLRGTGMAVRRDVVLGHRFHAPASEDLFFTIDLLLAGVRCRHVDAARLRSAGAPNWHAFGGQKVRYEAGRMAGARAYVPRLLATAVRRRDLACLEAAWFLATPPLGVAVLSLAVGAGLAVLAGATAVAAVYAAGLAAIGLTVVTGLVQARAGLRTWAALAAAPVYVVWKGVVQARAFVRVVRRDRHFEPTARA